MTFRNKNAYYFFIILMLSSFGLCHSQTSSSETSFFDNVRFGGSLGLSFSNDFFNGSLAPKAVYDLNQYSSLGVGLLSSYTKADSYTAFNYGGSLLTLFRPFRSLQLSIEFEELHVSRKWEMEGGNRENNYWYPALFLGGGYTAGPVTIGIRYDVLFEEEKSVYGNAFMPFVSIYL